MFATNPNSVMIIGVGIIVIQSFLIAYLWLLLDRKNKNVLELKINRVIEVSNLSAREAEVLKELMTGKSNNEVGETLFISPDTVKTHRKNIYKKLKIKSINELHSLVNAIEIK